MMGIGKASVVACLLAAATPVAAQVPMNTAADLLRWSGYKQGVRPPNEVAGTGFFYFMGVYQTLHEFQASHTRFCAPYGVANGNVALETLDWIWKHPAHWKRNATVVIAEALAEVFPCGR